MYPLIMAYNYSTTQYKEKLSWKIIESVILILILNRSHIIEEDDEWYLHKLLDWDTSLTSSTISYVLAI